LVPQPEGRGVDHKMPPSMPDEELVNALAQYLDLEAVEKQALLERDGLVNRCRSLIELLEMKVIVSRHAWGAGRHCRPGADASDAAAYLRSALCRLDRRRPVFHAHVADNRHRASRRRRLPPTTPPRLAHYSS